MFATHFAFKFFVLVPLNVYTSMVAFLSKKSLVLIANINFIILFYILDPLIPGKDLAIEDPLHHHTLGSIHFLYLAVINLQDLSLTSLQEWKRDHNSRN